MTVRDTARQGSERRGYARGVEGTFKIDAAWQIRADPSTTAKPPSLRIADWMQLRQVCKVKASSSLPCGSAA